jgi:predicted outer membrane repeat protein
MRRCLVLSVLFLGSVGLTSGDTHVPAGDVSGTWTLSGSPYIVDGELSIQSGYTLTIEPGVQVVFSDNYKFNVYGRLLAVGSETDSILFTAQDEDAGWNGLRFVDSNTNGQDSSKVVHCRIERGKPPTGASGSDRNGGGIYCENSSDILISETLIRKNRGTYGGGIYLDSSDVNIRDSRIDTNGTWQGGDGGGIYSKDSNPWLERVTIRGNHALESGYTGGAGGGMYFTHSNPILREVDVLDNWASAYYGGSGGGLYFADCPSVSLRDVVVSGNEAVGAEDDGYAGGIRIHASDATLERVTISGNEAGMYGGGMYLTGSSVDLEKVTVTGNTVVHPNGLYGGIYRTGSGILTIQCSIVFGNNRLGIVVSDSIDATYSDIQCDSGLYPGTGNIDEDPLFVSPIDSTQAPTTAGDFGLRWDHYPSASTPRSPCIDAGDPSPLFNDPDSTRCDMGARFFDQRYVSGIWPEAYAPYEVDHEITLPLGDELEIEAGAEVVFLGHHKFNVLGRLVAQGTETDSILFTAQDTSTGWHGLRFDDIDDNGQDSSRIEYCVFEYGRADGVLGEDRRGGAMDFVGSSNVSVEHCLFQHNVAGYGGAISCAYGSSPRFEEGIVRGNEASVGYYNYGGGVYCATNSHPSLTRVLISGNASTDEGGGIYLYGSSPSLTNVTIAGNAVTVGPSGGGLHGTNGSYPTMMNSIHRNNDPPAVSLSSSNLTATYSDLEESWPGTGNIDADPLFVFPMDPSQAPTALGDYHLTASSPCVDSGNPAPQYNDPDGTRNDMGAFYYDQYVYPPAADFEADTTIGWEPLEVGFTDQSTPGTGAIVAWKWHFGDGDSSEVQNPTHVYSDTGTYTVTLTVVDENDSSDTRIKADYIRVIEFGHIPGGDVKGTWYQAYSPYVIDGEITLQEGDELTIEPGVEVIFSGHYKFNVYGRLVAQGIEYDRILFTAENHGTGWHGLRFHDQDYNGQPNSVLEYCRIEYGRATGSPPDNCGGGIYATTSSSLQIDHSVICNNYATYRGGGMYCTYSDYMEPRNVTFSRNVASEGGAVYCEVTTLYLQSCILWDDTHPEVAKDAYSTVIAYYSDIDSSIVFPGVDNINEDPLFADPGGGDFRITWANFPTPDATRSPCIDAGDPDPGYDDPDGTRNDMGAFYFDQAPGTHVPSGTVSGTWTLLESPYFIEGEISIPEDSALAIEPGVCVNFQGHYKFNVYGRILAEGTESDSILFTAEDTTSGWGGLRFFLTDSTGQDSSRLLHCRLEYGKASGSSPDNRGGAVFCDSSSALRMGHCRFVRDSSYYGGAISLWYGSSPVIHDCSFQENVAEYVGGALTAQYGSSPTIDRCVFEDNYDQGGGGGAILCGNGSNPTLSRCTFARNISQNAGGALYCNNSSPSIDHCVFWDNGCRWYGGALYLYSGSNPTVENCTFHGNVADDDHGGGIYAKNTTTPIVRNCVLWANQSSQIYLSSASALVTYSDVQGGWTGTGNLDLDPLFEDPGSGDF